jgi:acetylornithine/succinyldiaminopimelate/putrescine aminotransferase
MEQLHADLLSSGQALGAGMPLLLLLLLTKFCFLQPATWQHCSTTGLLCHVAAAQKHPPI